MFTAYKYLKTTRGLLLVFEKGISLGPGLSLDVIRIENDPYLQIGKDHLLHLDDDTIECLKDCNQLLIAISGLFESRLVLQGTVEIDDISKGKLLAYVEMDK